MKQQNGLINQRKGILEKITKNLINYTLALLKRWLNMKNLRYETFTIRCDWNVFNFPHFFLIVYALRNTLKIVQCGQLKSVDLKELSEIEWFPHFFTYASPSSPSLIRSTLQKDSQKSSFEQKAHVILAQLVKKVDEISYWASANSIPCERSSSLAL